MEFTCLDEIYTLISNTCYNNITNYNKDDIEIVRKLRFPNLNLNLNLNKSSHCVTENRIHGSKFRNNIISRFNNKCALTNINSTLCEAAHILPYNKCGYLEKYCENNGILLSANMHKAFDKNFFTIDENTCKVKILFNNISNANININNIELESINNMYIKQLDNEQSKYFLQQRNNKIE